MIDNGGAREFNVAAVINDMPQNSHFKLELIEPMAFFERDYPDIYRQFMWSVLQNYSYLKLQPETNIEQLEHKLTNLLTDRQQNSNDGTRKVVSLKAIRDVHLHSQLANEPGQNGSLCK